MSILKGKKLMLNLHCVADATHLSIKVRRAVSRQRRNISIKHHHVQINDGHMVCG